MGHECYTLVITTGYYPSEISWNLTTADGSEWARGGATETVDLCAPTPNPTATFSPTDTRNPTLKPTYSPQPTVSAKPTDIAQCYTMQMIDS